MDKVILKKQENEAKELIWEIVESFGSCYLTNHTDDCACSWDYDEAVDNELSRGADV